MNSYYVYVYLDPRKPGSYIYNNYKFDYEPFYVGKGKGNRVIQHLQEHSLKAKNNNIKNGILNQILKDNFTPIYIKLHKNLSNDEALNFEKNIIFLIGRRSMDLGSLANLTDGGEGTEGRICNESTKQLMSQQRKGKKQTPAQYAANCNRKQTDNQKTLTSIRLKGIKQSKEFIEKRTKSLKGSTRSEEIKLKMSQQRKGKKQTPAQYAANCNRTPKIFLTYNEFKAWVKQNNITKTTHWKKLLKEKLIPDNIPKNPHRVYKNRGDWISWLELFS